MPTRSRRSAITYLEGYLWDPPHAKEAFRKAAKIAHDAGRKVALTLSDAFCVGRYRAEFLDLIKTGTVDLVFANESELKSLYETADFDTAVKALRGDAKLAVVTRSEKGCVVVSKDGMVAVPAAPIKKLVDATGAGDLFAAGFLFGLARGRDHKTAAQLGALAAAEVIQHIGARPEVSLKELAAAKRPAGLRLAAKNCRFNRLVSKSRLPVGKSTNRGSHRHGQERRQRTADHHGPLSAAKGRSPPLRIRDARSSISKPVRRRRRGRQRIGFGRSRSPHEPAARSRADRPMRRSPAGIALAAALGALAGAGATAALDARHLAAREPRGRRCRPARLQDSVAQLGSELATLKTGIANAQRSTTTQFGKLAERLDRTEKAHRPSLRPRSPRFRKASTGWRSASSRPPPRRRLRRRPTITGSVDAAEGRIEAAGRRRLAAARLL